MLVWTAVSLEVHHPAYSGRRHIVADDAGDATHIYWLLAVLFIWRMGRSWCRALLELVTSSMWRFVQWPSRSRFGCCPAGCISGSPPLHDVTGIEALPTEKSTLVAVASTGVLGLDDRELVLAVSVRRRGLLGHLQPSPHHGSVAPVGLTWSL